ncbi:MAG: peptidoglycan DD-metalloendopeptidase family protein [Bacillota bacterium]|uniref:M23 family metallopeptidase n=1 Tax=Virgibacillus salarius TaxID=447199 RepID=A0A941DWG8_9BACI|nr:MULTISPECIES: M23 family metallopeptidase [Bacillaceae]NAZ09666.1 peptidoglycan DD-metalloendopeptidase family protein [Agaribacter marinus]MBR7796956.1 M23 family metallopeptidase [Virgibacillus salarius]MCC2251124.1 M23 family metallopeptidase [Virgibacillus sp. AGTR]MDY7045297.1 M23 family metallopeptidase [Virgibacillus sp. M23]QRZ17565.1 M23 family metallopeptidase [Virgibacillus sp. AGTR]
MSKGIKKVRQSIEQRKKARGVPYSGSSKKQFTPPILQEEEKHGYAPVISDSGMTRERQNRMVSGFMLKGILSVLLFLGVALLWQMDSPRLQSSKEWTSNVLTEEFPFAKVNVWYQDTFGSPLAFVPEESKQQAEVAAMPVNGSVAESFQTNGTGIRIAPEGQTEVTALQEGIVIFAGNDRETNKTIVVQHPDSSKTTYGYLSNIDVHLYQHVSGNQKIGQFTPNEESDTVFFSIEKDNNYIDPVQVIKVDDVQ